MSVAFCTFDQIPAQADLRWHGKRNLLRGVIVVYACSVCFDVWHLLFSVVFCVNVGVCVWGVEIAAETTLSYSIKYVQVL